MGLVMQHGPGQCTCMDARMVECRNADEKLSLSSGLYCLVRHRHSGIGIPASWSVFYRWSRINPLVPSSDYWTFPADRPILYLCFLLEGASQ